MLTSRRTSPARRAPSLSRHLREIRLALRQIDGYVARMADPTDERLLAAAAVTIARSATTPTRTAA